jgi:hypothetical protein
MLAISEGLGGYDPEEMNVLRVLRREEGHIWTREVCQDHLVKGVGDKELSCMKGDVQVGGG